ncbi:MAG: glycosyltransferase [Candidatus Kapaibacterium sp.]
MINLAHYFNLKKLMMMERRDTQIRKSPIKLLIGCIEDKAEGFDTVDVCSFTKNMTTGSFRLPYPNDSVTFIKILNGLSYFHLNELDKFLIEISRVCSVNSTIELHFVDITNLINHYAKGKISLVFLNEMIYGSKSLVDRTYVIQMLNKHGFEITGFEFLEKNSWEDYNCIIKATCINKEYENELQLNLEFDTSVDDNFSVAEQYEQPGLINPKSEETEYQYETDLLEEVFSYNPKDNEIINTNDSDNDFDGDLLQDVLNFIPDEIPYHEDIPNTQDESDEEKITNLFKELIESSIEENQDNINKQTEYTESNNHNTIEPALNIVWEGSQFVYNPPALVNREICTEIIKTGAANVTIIPYESDDPDFNKSDGSIELLNNDIRRKKEVNSEIAGLPYAWIRHQFPPKKESPKGAKWIIMQGWEFTSLRKDMFEILKNADEVWTPSFFSRKSMVDSGIDFNKVQVIPNGINPNIFKPEGDKYNLDSDKSLKILYVGATIHRKGFDVLLKAYTECFNSSDDVCLVIKDTGNNSFYKGLTSENEIESAKSRNNAPEIIYIKENLTNSQMASLYRACDILTAPYRAESFCLPLLEAAACGLTVIASKGGPSDEYLDESFAKFINTEQIDIGDQIDGFPLVGRAYMLEPSLQHLKDILVHIYNNPGDIISKGAIASAYVRSKWTWTKSAVKALRRLDFHFGTKMSMRAEENSVQTQLDSDLFGHAEKLYSNGEFNEAAELYKKVIESIMIEEYKILALHRLAIIYINRSKLSDAYECLKSIKQINANHPDTIYAEALINLAEQNITEALEKINILLDDWKNFKFMSSLGHNLDDLLVLTADLLLTFDDVEAAHSLYTTALSLNNENEYACYGAALCFYKSELYEHSQNMLEWAVKLNPDFEKAKQLLYEISSLN